MAAKADSASFQYFVFAFTHDAAHEGEGTLQFFSFFILVNPLVHSYDGAGGQSVYFYISHFQGSVHSRFRPLEKKALV